MLAPIALQSKSGPTTLDFSGERLVNYMLRPGEGVSPANVLGTSGLDRFAKVSDQPVQAMVVMGGNLYAASDGKLWKVTPAGAVSEVGDTPYYVTRMVSNGFEIGIVGGGAYYLSDGSTVSQVAVPSLPGGVTDIAFLDQYFVLAGSTGVRDDALTVSGLLDGSTFDAIDVAFAENDPDGIVALVRNGPDLWVLGSNGYEVFYNAGAAAFPLLPRGVGGTIACASARGAALSNDILFWVRPDGALMTVSGYGAQKISSPEMQEAIAAGTLEALVPVTDRAHDVIAIVMKDGPAWCFDISTGLVHERATGADFGPWAVRSSVKWLGVDYVGTSRGAICQLCPTCYDADGDVQPAQAVTSPAVGLDWFTINQFRALISGGVGVTGRAPQVFLETSRDGRNWSDTKPRDLGEQGEYLREARWNGLGAFRRFQARLTVTDAVPRDVLGVTIG